MERLALEILDPGKAGQLGDMQRSCAHADIFGSEFVTPVGPDDPDVPCCIPFQVIDLGMEQGVVIQPEMRPDARAMIADFGRMGIFFRRHVPGFLEQRHVDQRRRIALRAGIAVPVPGPAKIAALFDDPDIVNARLLQPRSDDQARETATDEDEGHMIGDRGAFLLRRVGIDCQVRKLAFQPDILRRSIRAQALVAFLGIFCLQGFLVDGNRIHC